MSGSSAAEVSFVPLPHPYGPGAQVRLPRPLTPDDALRLRRIFTAQAHGAMTDATNDTARLNSPVLTGTVLADRYLRQNRRPDAPALSLWLARYADLPDAPAIRALLLSSTPLKTIPGSGQAAAISAAQPQPSPAPRVLSPAAASNARPSQAHDQAPSLDRLLRQKIASGQAAAALRLVARRRGLSIEEAGRLRAEITRQLFLQNEDAAALRVAEAELTGTAASAETFFAGGLAAWRLGRLEVAAPLFIASTQAAAGGSDHLRAASAFWASRVTRRLGDARGTVTWLQAAAAEQQTFYGVLAHRILLADSAAASQARWLGQADVDAVAATPAGWRACALLQVDQPERAKAELRGLLSEARARPVFGRSLVLVASAMGMGDLAAQLARDLQPGSAEGLAVPALRPVGGFQVEPPLMYALARVESNFDPNAVSAEGAQGLLQIRPATARSMTGEPARTALRLHEPALNLALGQRYLATLSGIGGIGTDLIRVLASYNAGPSALLRWAGSMQAEDDPLLFIEAIPSAETRAYVTEALAYSWLYASEMRLPAPSLDALAAGEFPRFTPPRQERRIAWMASGAD